MKEIDDIDDAVAIHFLGSEMIKCDEGCKSYAIYRIRIGLSATVSCAGVHCFMNNIAKTFIREKKEKDEKKDEKKNERKDYD